MEKRQTAIRLRPEQAARITQKFGTLSGGATEIVEKTEELMHDLGLSLDVLLDGARTYQVMLFEMACSLGSELGGFAEQAKAYKEAPELAKQNPDLLTGYLSGRGLLPAREFSPIEKCALLCALRGF